MKTFKNQAAQGDFLIRRIKAIPDGVKAMPADGDRFVLAHSETGHHHVIPSQDVVAFEPIVADRVSMIYLKVEQVTQITHLRANDTHEALKVEPGIFEVRRQREIREGRIQHALD